MAVIKIPKAPMSAINKDRPVSSLLRMQLEHMQHAEFRLPANMQTNVYINAIKTEGEAADYIRKVTERLHAAHGSQIKTGKTAGTRRHGLEIAASAAGRSSSKAKGKTAKKKASVAPRKKKR